MNEEPPVFECRLCGDCCKGYGGTYVTENDIRAIAAFIKTDPETFVRDYCRISCKRPVLAQGEDGFCVFWDKVCTIHPVKPRMCRRWPFIPAVLEDPRNWAAMAGACPGMNTDADMEQVLEAVRSSLAAEADPSG